MTVEPSVFISYVRRNKRRVGRLVEDLRAKGIVVYWDQDIPAAADWAAWIDTRIRQDDFFIVCFSKQYHEAEETYVNDELDVAIARMRKLKIGRTWFIPVRLDACDVPALPVRWGRTLKSYNRVDMWGSKWEGGVAQIVEAILPLGPVPAAVRGSLLRLKDPDAATRKKAARELGDAGHVAAVDPLCAALGDEGEDYEVRVFAARALGQIGDRRAADGLVAALARGDDRLRAAAAKSLGTVGGVGVVGALVTALGAAGTNVRVGAIQSLGELGSAGKIDAGDMASVVKGLEDVAMHDSDNGAASKARGALRAVGGVLAGEALKRCWAAQG